jgi:esterase
MKLHFEKLGQGEPLLILHGLLGSGRNWKQFSQKFLSLHFEVYLIDLRNHGLSPHHEDCSFEAMANDIAELAHNEELTSFKIAGHSMGGRVLMTLMQLYPNLVSEGVVIDVSPLHYEGTHQPILDALSHCPVATLSTREAVDQALSEGIPDTVTRRFVMQNLTRLPEGGYAWKMGLSHLQKYYFLLYKALEFSITYAAPFLFVRGGKAEYLPESHFETIQKTFSNAQFYTIEDSGHLIHFEQPEKLANAMLKFLMPNTKS